MSPNSSDVWYPCPTSTKVIRTKNFKFKLHLIWNGLPTHLQKILFKNCREHTHFRAYGRFSKVIHILIYNTTLHKCIITEICNKTKTHQTWPNTYEDVHKQTSTYIARLVWNLILWNNLEENQEEIFQVIDMGKIFLNTNLKALERTRIDKWDCINLQGFHTTKEKNGMKNQPSQWEKYELFS